MQFDKDTLTKHRFWVLLCVSLPLVLVAMFLLWVVVPGQTAQERNKVESERGKLKGIGNLKNDAWIRFVKTEADRAKAQETEVWQKAWDQQQDVITWPAPVEADFKFRKGLFANVIAIQGKEAKLAELPEDTPHLFHGTLTKIHSDYIEVAGRKSAGKRFQRVAGGKIYRAEEADKTLSSEEFGTYDGKRVLVAVSYQTGKYFGDPLTDTESTKFMVSYKDQIRDVLEEAGPLNALDETLVQFKGWTFRKGDFVGGKGYTWKETDYPPPGAKFFYHVGQQWKPENDISDEAWAAQEDLCLQREMFRLVRQANDYVARFKPDPEFQSPDKKSFKGTNSYWNLELNLKGNKLHVKITNLLDKRQRVDVRLRVKFEEGGAFQVIPPANSPPLGAEPLAPHGMASDKDPKTDKQVGQSDTFEDVLDVQRFTPKGIYAVEQLLTWETAAVKRIDQISFGGVGGVAHSHRTSDKTLVAYRKKAAPDAAAPDKVDPMGDDPKPMPMVPPLQREFEGKQIIANQSPNGLALDRYLSVTPQARRIPVAIVVIADQTHVHRVLNSFADSKLRFLITQVVWHRYPLSVRPQEVRPTGEGLEPGEIRPGEPIRPKGFVPETGQPPGEGDPTKRPTVTEEPESNVELIIYGIATLYERFPPRQQQPANTEAEKQ